MGKYDIFISYRRDGGEQSAKAIFDRLKDRGYNVFLDVETLRSGAFNQKLYSVIEECQDVLVILSPDALDRCNNEDDWVRLEIAHGLRCKKNMIPVMLRGFTFPEELPEDIEEIRYQNGVQASVEFFDTFLEKLCGFLKSRSGIVQRLQHSLSWRRSMVAVGCCLLIALGIWGGSVIIQQNALKSGAYPVTQKQKNDVNSLLYNVQMNLTVMDNMLHSMENSIKACEDYLAGASPNGYAALVAQLDHAAGTMSQQAEQAQKVPSELTVALSGTEINMADLAALAQYPEILLFSHKGSLENLKYVMDPEKPFDDATRKRVLAIYKELVQLDADTVFIGLCQLLLPIDESALKDFRTEYLPVTYVVSNRLQLWSRDEVGLKSQQDSIFTQQQKLINEYAQLVGDMNKEFLSEKEALVRMLVGQGVSEDEAKNYVEGILNKTQAVSNSQEKLALLNQQLEEGKKQLREKFAPKETDDPYLVWGKALRFLSVGMYDEAVDAMQFHLTRVKSADANAALYVPAAINFVRQIGNTGIDYGIIVIGYEPNKPPHSIYKIGDIIVAVNGTPCRKFPDFQKVREGMPAGSGYTATLLRTDANGKLQLTDVEIPAGQPKTAFMELTENE